MELGRPGPCGASFNKTKSREERARVNEWSGRKRREGERGGGALGVDDGDGEVST